MAKKLSASSRREPLRRVKRGDITLTTELKKELMKAKRKKPDLSDEEVPDVSDWEGGIRNKFYRPIKAQITIRIDADVLDWFRHHEKYQSLINKACREYMNLHLPEDNR